MANEITATISNTAIPLRVGLESNPTAACGLAKTAIGQHEAGSSTHAITSTSI